MRRITRLLLEVIDAKLDATLARLSLLETKENQIMSLAEDLKQGIAALDAETTAVADRIDKLTQRLADSSVSDQEKQDILASLSAETARLKTLGTDPNNPVPPVPPPLAQARKKKTP